MVDSDQPQSPEFRNQPSDPVDCLLLGEVLSSAGRQDAADTVLANGIKIIHDELSQDTLANPENAHHILTCLRYTRADLMRVRSANCTGSEATIYQRLANAELNELEDYSRFGITLTSPYERPSDDVLYKNGHIYLACRARGFLALYQAYASAGPDSLWHSLKIARINLYMADEALAGGIFREDPLIPPQLPDKENVEQVALYQATLIAQKIGRRKIHRETDPSLAIALRASTLLLELSSMAHPPEISIPGFSGWSWKKRSLSRIPKLLRVPGPRVSQIFNFGDRN